MRRAARVDRPPENAAVVAGTDPATPLGQPGFCSVDAALHSRPINRVSDNSVYGDHAESSAAHRAQDDVPDGYEHERHLARPRLVSRQKLLLDVRDSA